MTTNNHTILVIEDDAAIRRGVVDSLAFAGYVAAECADGGDAMDCVAETSPDLVLLDVMLPGRDGFALLADIRETHPTLPVIMVTAKGAESDRVGGLKGGADDYIVKPFSPRELLARIEAVLRRSPERPKQLRGVRLGERRVDFGRREICFGDHRTQLSDREARILEHLAQNAGRAVCRDELLHRVWGLNPRGMTTRTVDMHVARLREKLEAGDYGQPLIITVRGEGYMLSSDAEIERAAAEAAP